MYKLIKDCKYIMNDIKIDKNWKEFINLTKVKITNYKSVNNRYICRTHTRDVKAINSGDDI